MTEICLPLLLTFSIFWQHTKTTSPLEFVVCLAPLAQFGPYCLVHHQRWVHSYMTPARCIFIYLLFLSSGSKTPQTESTRAKQSQPLTLQTSDILSVCTRGMTRLHNGIRFDVKIVSPLCFIHLAMFFRAHILTTISLHTGVECWHTLETRQPSIWLCCFMALIKWY